jgi:hypothetical protein
MFIDTFLQKKQPVNAHEISTREGQGRSRERDGKQGPVWKETGISGFRATGWRGLEGVCP